MAKSFEITYSPAEWNAPQGGVASQWTSPYGGLHVQAPDNLIGPQYSPYINNFILRNAELRSRPVLRQFLPGPDDNNPILAVGSFLSIGGVWHTFSFTKRGLFQLTTNSQQMAAQGQNPWIYLGGPTLGSAPVSWRAYAGILYYTNEKHLCAWDGAAAAPINDVAFVGAAATSTVYGGYYLGELGNHLILGLVSETTSGVTTMYPNRIRWSNNGFNPIGGTPSTFGGNLGTAGATFDPTIMVNAGVNDMMDVPDLITGTMFIGRSGFIFRQNGVTEMSTTGKGIAPFDFNHLWASQNGIGSVYPFSLAQYGNVGIFISNEQVYRIGIGALEAIGGMARDAIIGDIANTVGVPVASIDRGFRMGYSYLVYHLRIPMVEGTRSYVFSFDDNNWTRWTSEGSWPYGRPNEGWI